MALDTYEEFRERWNQLIGEKYLHATAKLPWQDGYTYVGLAALGDTHEHTYTYLRNRMQWGDDNQQWLSQVQLLLHPEAEYIDKTIR